MKNLFLIAISLTLLIACGGDDDPCEQKDYVGTYIGSKEGSLCNNDDSYTFSIIAVPNSNDVIIDGHAVTIQGCTFQGSAAVAGVNRDFEGTFDGENLSMTESALFGSVGCTWIGVKQQ